MSEHRGEFVNKALLGLLCGSLGFGLSQLTVASEVKVHGRDIAVLHETVKDERARTDARIFELAALMKAQLGLQQALVDQNKELISLVRVHLGIKGTQ